MALLTAPAGAGKTRTIAAAATVWHALTGGRLIGLTLSENAARVMTTEGLPEAYNIAQFLGKCRDSDRLRHPVHVGPADKLVIDEAGQVGTADLALIQQAAGPAGVLGVGDPAQLGPVEAGGWFSWFATELGAAELSEVRRFASPWEADASLQLRRGDKSALAAYDAHGRIRAGDREAMHDKAALAFLADFLDGQGLHPAGRLQRRSRRPCTTRPGQAHRCRTRAATTVRARRRQPGRHRRPRARPGKRQDHRRRRAAPGQPRRAPHRGPRPWPGTGPPPGRRRLVRARS